MPREEPGESLGRAPRVLHVQEVRGARELEGLDVRKPGEKELPPLREGPCAVLTNDDEDGLGDSARLLLGERPALPQRRQLLGEERVRVRDRAVESAGEPSVQRLAVLRPEDTAEERVD